LLYTGSMGDPKGVQWPPVRVNADDAEITQKRADACGLKLTEYIRYRVLGKRVLTGDQVEKVKAKEKPVD
jgi:hypothetical protein